MTKILLSVFLGLVLIAPLAGAHCKDCDHKKDSAQGEKEDCDCKHDKKHKHKHADAKLAPAEKQEATPSK